MCVKIVPCGKEHIEGIFMVEKASFPHPWTKAMFEEEIKNENAMYFAAVSDNGSIVGYGGFWCVAGDAQITNIAVIPAFRRKHIGEKILEKILLCAKELSAEGITLEVRKSNTPAQKLYEKMGFETVGVRKRYYKDNNEDAYLMLKKTGE